MMHKWLAYIACLFGCLSMLAMALSLYAALNAAGVAILAFQLWTVLTAVTALVLGGVSRFISHRKSVRHAFPAKMGIVFGALALVFLIGSMTFSG